MNDIIKILIFISCLSSLAVCADSFKPVFPEFRFDSTNQVKRYALKQVKAAKFANGVQMPFYQIGLTFVGEEGFQYQDIACADIGCQFDFAIHPSEAEKLKLFHIVGLGYMLLPRNWQRFEAESATNGSGDFIIQNAEATQAITMLNTAYCYGCALTSGNRYFPELQRLLDIEGYSGNKDSKQYLHLVYAKPDITFFSYQIPNHPFKTHGVAYYRYDGGLNFKKAEVTLANKKLASTILNFYNFQLKLAPQ